MRVLISLVAAAVIPAAIVPAFLISGQRPLDAVMLPVQAFFIGLFVYHLILVVAGVQLPEAVPAMRPRTRFAVLVAAYNEEPVIPQLVESLVGQQYPRRLFTVFVVADHCDDRTAATALAAGARVYERSGDARRGKGPAIEWLLQRIWEEREAFDAVVIFDADNVAAPTFLQKMDAYLQRGDQVIQGYLGTKNLDDSWMTRAIYASYAYTNRFFQLAKQNLGLSSALGGTGLCIAMPLLRRLGWRCDALTEDLEFQVRAILEGVRPTWGWEAIVYDEKPLTFRAAWQQRRRWMQGHASVAVRYLGRLLRRVLTTRDPVAIDAVIYLSTPIWLSLAMLLYASYLANQFVSVYTYLYPVWVPPLLIAVSFVYPYVALQLENLPSRTYLRPSTLAGVILLSLCWPLLGLLGMLQYRRRYWVKTTHTRGLSIGDVRQQQHALTHAASGSQMRIVRALAVTMIAVALVATVAPHLAANKLRSPLEEGGMFLLQGKTQLALEHFQAAVRDQPNDSIAYGFLALAYRKLGSRLAALQAALTVKRLDPTLETTVVAIVDFMLRHRASPNSERLMGEALNMVRSAPDAYAWVANLFIDRGRWKDAEIIVDDGLRRFGQQVPLLRVEGFIHYSLRRYAEAVLVLRLASQKAPTDIGLLINLGWAYLKTGELSAAIAVWEGALKLDPTNEALRRDLAWAKSLLTRP